MTIAGLHRRLAAGRRCGDSGRRRVATLGFITLGFEMIASRILTPLFGGDIYTWATIISIVVAGLMAGYFIGGMAADRYPTFAFAAGIKLVAAAYIVFVWLLTGGGLEAFLSGIHGRHRRALRRRHDCLLPAAGDPRHVLAARGAPAASRF